MRLTDRLSQPQRIVIVIALGVAFLAVGAYVTGFWGTANAFGWYAYAPISPAAPHTGLPGWLRLIIWLVLVALWALASVRVLRTAPSGVAD